MKNDLVEISKKYLLKGYSPIPISRGSKAPWLSGWSNFCTQLPEDKLVANWFSNARTGGIGIACGKASNVTVFDLDLDENIPEQAELLNKIRHLLPDSPVKRIGKKGLAYFCRYNGETKKSIKWNGIVAIDILGDGSQCIIPPTIHPEINRPYEWVEKELLEVENSSLPIIDPEALSEIERIVNGLIATGEETVSSTGGRNDLLKSFVVKSLKAGKSVFETARMACTYDRFHHAQPLFLDQTEPQMRGNEPEVNALRMTLSIKNSLSSKGVQFKAIDNESSVLVDPSDIEIELPDETLHGIVGDFVRAVEPHTESDPKALLLQFLVAGGNVVGRHCYMQVEADRHYANLFAVIVGKSSKGRKGTSLGHIANFFAMVDRNWSENNTGSGLSTGEGLLKAVAEKPAPVDDPPQSVSSERQNDKRFLAIEGEFAALLRVSARDQNTISTTLRNLWDKGSSRIMTKVDPVRVNNAHISLIGHITQFELLQDLKDKDRTNGFANRILWLRTERSKVLPFGGNINEINWTSFLRRFNEIVEFAKVEREITWSGEAKKLWAENYERLSEGGDGLVGVVTSRAEAQVLRLALLYAIFDCSEQVLKEHLEASLAVWKICEASAHVIFGGYVGSGDADHLLMALKESPQGLTESEILRGLFQKNRKSSEIKAVLNFLRLAGRVDYFINYNTGGRPATVWYLKCHSTEESRSQGDQTLDSTYEGD